MASGAPVNSWFLLEPRVPRMDKEVQYENDHLDS